MRDNHGNYNFKLKNKSITELLSEFRTSSVESFQNVYNIKFNKDGTVFDKSSKLCYSTLQSWAKDALRQLGELK